MHEIILNIILINKFIMNKFKNDFTNFLKKYINFIIYTTI